MKYGLVDISLSLFEMFLNNARFTLDKDTFEDEKIDLFIYFIRI